MEDLVAFARLVNALRPWLDQLVVIGGWAHRLHRLHPHAGAPAYRPLLTRDADLAFSDAARLRGDIGEALRSADFREEFSSEYTPPIAQYRLGTEDSGGFYAEFLAPLRGDGRRRDGSPDATLRRAGITAQRLRHLEVLLESPWEVSLPWDERSGLDAPAAVAIANPVTFTAQKLLIHDQRPPAKRAQDVLYIHDTLELFGAELDTLSELWRARIRPSLPETTARRIEVLGIEQFGTITDDVREAARIPQDRRLRPERVQQLCAYGLRQIFSPAVNRR